MSYRFLFRALSAAALLALGVAAASASTLEEVKARGRLLCGVNTGLQGFAQKGADGAWTGFDVDYCRAVAAAVLGDAGKVDYVPLDVSARFAALKEGKIDILARNSTWTMGREVDDKLRFAGVSYYDGQGFMVKKLLGVASVYNLGQAAVCVAAGTTSEANLADYFGEKDMAYVAVPAATAQDGIAHYEAGKCDTYTADQSQLYGLRLTLAKPDDTVILPEVISREPLGPFVRQGDEQWFSIARWVLFALIDAEELGITAAGVEAAKGSRNGEVKRLLGVEGTLGSGMGLDAQWAVRAIAATGNYGEIFKRNLGEESALKITRGLNALWKDGGLLYAPPVR
jgi:general L-amino acid transport system substrate-binding protein